MSPAAYVGIGAIAIALSVALSMSASIGASSGKKSTAAPAKGASTAPTTTATGTPVGPGQGAPVKDPALGGLCTVDTKTRPKACGSVNCPGLQSCPTYSWMGMQKFVVGKLGRAPTGIT